MHPRWLAMAGVLVVTSAAGCAYGIKATSDHNPQVDFSPEDVDAILAYLYSLVAK